MLENTHEYMGLQCKLEFKCGTMHDIAAEVPCCSSGFDLTNGAYTILIYPEPTASGPTRP